MKRSTSHLFPRGQLLLPHPPGDGGGRPAPRRGAGEGYALPLWQGAYHFKGAYHAVQLSGLPYDDGVAGGNCGVEKIIRMKKNILFQRRKIFNPSMKIINVGSNVGSKKKNLLLKKENNEEKMLLKKKNL